MALTANEIGIEVQTETGKVSDTVNITTARCLRWLNQSIKDIIYQYPGIRDVHKLDKYTWQCATGVYEFETTDFIEYPIAHIIKLKYVNITGTSYGWILPYPGGLDQWDEDFPYVPDADSGTPCYYVQRGYTVEVVPVPSSAEDGSAIWVEYSYMPSVLTASDYPVLTNFDECLIEWSKSYAFKMLGKTDEAKESRTYAEFLVERRLEGEQDWDDSDQIPYNGPM